MRKPSKNHSEFISRPEQTSIRVPDYTFCKRLSFAGAPIGPQRTSRFNLQPERYRAEPLCLRWDVDRLGYTARGSSHRGVCADTTSSLTDRQTDLVQTFADQAVIAIETRRLFDEVQAVGSKYAPRSSIGNVDTISLLIDIEEGAAPCVCAVHSR
jgi:hypothetical protein